MNPRLAVTIRKGHPDDAARIHELHLASVRALCSGHYPPTTIDRWLERRTPSGYHEPIARGVIFVAQEPGRIVGFAETAPGSIEAIFVDPTVLRRGIGRALLDQALVQARIGHNGPIRLEATLNARDFYEVNGFREIARTTIRRNQTDIPAVLMEHSARQADVSVVDQSLLLHGIKPGG